MQSDDEGDHERERDDEADDESELEQRSEPSRNTTRLRPWRNERARQRSFDCSRRNRENYPRAKTHTALASSCSMGTSKIRTTGWFGPINHSRRNHEDYSR